MKRTAFLLFLLTVSGGILHYYNLNWGAPWYFHPDERNIASAVSQLHFPDQMNPHFFAYGSLPLSIIYATGVLKNGIAFLFLSSQTAITYVSFETAILISREYSALFATLIIPLLFLLGKQLRNEKIGLLAAFFATFSTGIIQFAHFGTFEMWLTFFTALLFFYCLKYLSSSHFRLVISIALLFGILLSIKISSIILLPICLFVFVLRRHYKAIPVFLLCTVCFYLITNPYVLIVQNDFISSIRYESSVGLGTLSVFYTGGFFDTIPVLYQFLHVYPFLLNPLLTILLIPVVFLSILETLKKRNISDMILLLFFFILFFAQAFLFVKWTRYFVPTLPFIYLLIACVYADYQAKFNKTKSLLFFLFLIICIISSLSYFKTAFLSLDTRLLAFQFAKKHIIQDAQILSEPSDLGLIIFQNYFPKIETFNFYEYDNASPDVTRTQMQQELGKSDYIILPSQRILQIRMNNPKKFPNGYLFYTSLINNRLGYHEIYKTPCDIFCQIAYVHDPIYWDEQTATIFDRPTVFIFQKNSAKIAK